VINGRPLQYRERSDRMVRLKARVVREVQVLSRETLSDL